MPHDPLQLLIRSLGQLGDAAGALVSDGELLERFVCQRDQAAFELLIWRHGPMILSACRRMLADPHDAEDAFQTTFLVLVRKAASVRRGETLGGWLYQVAHRVCLRLGAARARRAAREQPGVEMIAAPTSEEHELREVLDEEIQRLPARQRIAFILCCLEGKTGEEAAHLIGCPPGTVSSRLSRARERLRSRLQRRGIVVPAGVVLAAAVEASAMAVPVRLLTVTIAGAGCFAGGRAVDGMVSATILSHVEGVLRAMVLSKLKNAACIVLLLGILLSGGMFAGQALLAQQAAGDTPRDAPPALDPTAGKQKSPAPIVVTVAKPERGSLPRRAAGACRAVAFDRADVGARVSGELKSVRVDIGARVRKGDLLAEIDAPQLTLDEDLAKNAVRQAQNLVAEADASVRIAKAEIELAKNYITTAAGDLASTKAAADEARSRYERDRTLFAQKAIDAAQLSQSRAAVEKFRFDALAKEGTHAAARTDVVVKEGKLLQTEAARRTALGKVEAAELSLSKVRLTLASTQIYAPIDGVVTLRRLNAGDMVYPRESGQAALFTVERTDLLRVVIDAPANAADAIEVGAEVDLAFGALGTTLQGQKVARTGFAIDPKTHALRVDVDVPNPQQKLRPGMSGGASIHLSSKPDNRVLRIPAGAIVGFASPAIPMANGLGINMPSPSGDPYVYVVRAGKTHRVVVQIGQSNGEQAEILSGLSLDDVVVTNPQVLQGAAVPVQIKTAPAAK